MANDSLEPGLLEAWVAAYIESESCEDVLDEHHSSWWAVEQIWNDCEYHPESAWAKIMAVLDHDPPDRVLGNLAAGPLEELVNMWGTDFIDRIELAIRQKPEFRKLMHGVWESSTPDVWNRIVKARGEDVRSVIEKQAL